MIRDQLREAYRSGRKTSFEYSPWGSIIAREQVTYPPDELVVEEPEVESFPLHVDVECVAYTLSLTKSTDDRIVYERDK